MIREHSKGTKLAVFSGREAKLNRVILQILRQPDALIAYDVWLAVKRIKGFRHTDIKSVYRRMGALELQGWITIEGNRSTQPGWSSDLHKISIRGIAALALDEKSIEDFLRKASDEQLLKFIEAIS